ncbi:IclR family transcriptional regulator [Bacillus smithii]|uniref:IclR family transcriptional regulator n=1 Tax=Bacillus smithii TaxID=1479 RepID=UPI003D249457
MTNLKTSDKQVNSTVVKALMILEKIASSQSGISLAGLVKELDLPKSTIHRLIETLKSYKYIDLDPNTEKYFIGLKMVEIGVSGLHNIEVVDVASPYLTDLAEKTGETAFLAGYYEGEIVYLNKKEGTQSIRTTAKLGMRRPVHCTAVGKAILSTFTLEEVEKILLEKGMKKYTKNTIVDIQKFHQELSAIRREGFAIDKEEIEIGLICYAVPIFNYTGRVTGSIGLGGPTLRMLKNQKECVARLKESALQISRRLGFVPNLRSRY